MGLRLVVAILLLWCPPITSDLLAADLASDSMVSFALPQAPLTAFQRQRLGDGAQNRLQGEMVGRLRVPRRTGQKPAAVVIRTCHAPSFYTPWLDRLNDWGFVTLSFSRCQPPHGRPDDAAIPSLDWKRGALAAIGALEHLANQDDVDPQAIVVIGWSRLGTIPLSVLNAEGFSQFFSTKFAAGVAFYPFCSFARGPHVGPILIISAEDDDHVDTDVCARNVGSSQGDLYPMRLKIIPGAVHGFDIEAHGPPHLASRAEINPDAFAADGGTLGFSAVARDQAIAEVKSFLTPFMNRSNE